MENIGIPLPPMFENIYQCLFTSVHFKNRSLKKQADLLNNLQEKLWKSVIEYDEGERTYWGVM